MKVRRLRVGKRCENDILIPVLFASSLFAAAILAIPVGGFQLSVFRALLMFCAAFFVLPKNKICGKYSITMLIWLVYAIVSLAWTRNFSVGLQDVYFIFSAFVLVSYFSLNMDNEKVFLNSCRLYTIGILVHNLIGYFEMTTRVYRWAEPNKLAEYLRAKNAYPVSVFYNPNNFSVVLLFGVAILAIAFKNSKKMIAKIFYIALMISSVYLIFRTQSRATLLALIIGIAIFLLQTKIKNEKALLGAMVGLVVTGAFLLSPFGEQVIQQVTNSINFDFTSGTSDAYRNELLLSGWNAFVGTFGLGTGAGGLSSAMQATGGLSGRVHFWWLEVLFTYGVIVWLGYLFCYCALMRKCRQNAKHNIFESRVFFSFLIAFILAAVSASSLLNSETLWCAWAFIIAYENKVAPNKLKKSQGEPLKGVCD